MNWKERLSFFGFCSVSRRDDKAMDARIEATLTQHAKDNGLEYVKGMMCHSLIPSSRKNEWVDEKLQQKRKRR